MKREACCSRRGGCQDRPPAQERAKRQVGGIMIEPHHNRRKVDHPGWAVARLAVIMAPLTVVLWANASKFDWTEVKAILEFGILAGGFEGIRLLKGR